MPACPERNNMSNDENENEQAVNIGVGAPVAALLEFVESIADDPDYKTPGGGVQYVFAFNRPRVGEPFVVLSWPVGLFVTSSVTEVSDPGPDNTLEFKTRNTKYRLRLVPADFTKNEAEAAN
jgi:hypothetical protein